MKTSYHIVSFLAFIFLFSSLSLVNAQEKVYENQLETVYLTNAKEIVHTNTFASYNEELLAEGTIKFRKEIRVAKKQHDLLYFVSNKNTLELLTSEYLKTIRKAANRSRDHRAFQSFLKERLPELNYEFTTDTMIESLYIMSRKDTFNGKIDALPSVI